MSAPNLLNPTTVTGKVVGVALSTTGATDIVANASSSGKSLYVRSLTACNVGAATATITVEVQKSGSTSYRLVYQVGVAINQTLVVIGNDRPIILEENDKIRATAGTSNIFEIVAAYDDIS